jgi:ABC-type transport system substrate-binding protein
MTATAPSRRGERQRQAGQHPAARVAALLSGDVHRPVPTADFARLKKDKNVVISSVVSNRVIYLSMDTNRRQPVRQG